MYKDKDKQKEANRLAAQKRRNKSKGMTEGMTIEQGMTPKGMTNQGMTREGMTKHDKEVKLLQSIFGPVQEDTFAKLIDKLPQGVSRPLGLPNADTAKLSSHDLSYAVRRCPGTSWLESAAYAETIYRLLTQDEPQVSMIPAWRAVA